MAVGVFEGSLHDDKTLPAQIDKLKERVGLQAVIVVLDGGMVTKANLKLLRKTDGASWITALKAPQVKKLVTHGDVQLSLFDQHDLAEIALDDYPDERLVLCCNPLVAQDRALKREDLLEATERALEEIERLVSEATLGGEAAIGLVVGAVWNRWRVKKHFEVEIEAQRFRSGASSSRSRRRRRSTASTSYVPASARKRFLRPTWCAPTQLKEVEPGFRSSRARSSCVPSITGSRIASRRTSSSACAPTPAGTCTGPGSRCSSTTSSHPSATTRRQGEPLPVGPARKAQIKRTAAGEPCHSPQTLLGELATRTRNTVRLHGAAASFDQPSGPIPAHAGALALVESYTPTECSERSSHYPSRWVDQCAVRCSGLNQDGGRP